MPTKFVKSCLGRCLFIYTLNDCFSTLITYYLTKYRQFTYLWEVSILFSNTRFSYCFLMINIQVEQKKSIKYLWPAQRRKEIRFTLNSSVVIIPSCWARKVGGGGEKSDYLFYVSYLTAIINVKRTVRFTFLSALKCFSIIEKLCQVFFFLTVTSTPEKINQKITFFLNYFHL